MEKIYNPQKKQEVKAIYKDIQTLVNTLEVTEDDGEPVDKILDEIYRDLLNGLQDLYPYL